MFDMASKPTYEQLEQRILKLEEADFKRKRAEETLQRSEMLLKETQIISKMGGWEYDVQTNVSTFTDMIFAIYGETFSDPEEGINFYHIDDRMVVMQSFENAIAKNEPYDIEVRFINAQGDNLWVRTVGKPVVKDGKVVKIIGNLMDITERKQAEEALRESEERYRSVYHIAPLAFVVWDKNTHVTDWNRKAEEVFGWSKEEVVGYSFFDFIIPEKNRPHVEDVVESLMKGELSIYSINDNLTKEGNIITCEWNNSTLHDSEGNIIGAISLGLDITDRKQVEDERKGLIIKLQESIKNIKTLKGMLPICASCKKIRDDKGYWNQIEAYIHAHSEAEFSHGICPECAKKLYPDLDIYKD